MVANDNKPRFDVDALGRVYVLRPDGSRGMLVSRYINETDFHDVLRSQHSGKGSPREGRQ